MAHGNQARLFDTGQEQSDMFGMESAPAYRPDTGKVRARLHKLLAEARSKEALTWEPATVSLYKTIFPQMSLFLPEEEGTQLRLAFEQELARLLPSQD